MDDPKENASSLTGRLPNEPEIQFLKPPELPTYLREVMDFLANETATMTGIDFSRKSDSMGAMLVRYVDGRMEIEHLTGIQGRKADLVIIDDLVSDGSTIVEDMKLLDERLAKMDFSALEMRALAMMEAAPGFTEIYHEPTKRYQHGFFKVDYDPMEMRRQRMKPDIKKLAKAKKDKSYLALDPTKNHRKRRR